MDNIKTMPHSESAEEAVIGSILIDGGRGFERANAWIRESNAFYSDKNKILYETISILHRENKNIDIELTEISNKEIKFKIKNNNIDVTNRFLSEQESLKISFVVEFEEEGEKNLTFNRGSNVSRAGSVSIGAGTGVSGSSSGGGY